MIFSEPEGASPIEWASGFDLQADNERRKAYIAALRAADGGDFGPLLAFVGATATAPEPS